MHTPHVTDDLALPVETRRIFKRVGQSSDVVQSAFQSACRMYQLSLILGRRRPTVRASYQYGAIDSIVKSDSKKYSSFTDFMTRYSEADTEMCELLHSEVRSAHWHSGRMPLGELHFGRGDFIYDPAVGQMMYVTRESHKLMRTAILNWLNELVQFSEG